ncbi:putative nucleotide-sugar epimerase [Streptomyces sp. NBRC 110611]|uniref:NAD-dependent epimerase/dehydratase family protein n=1 Tax=Streptomyces sp. NBRC 110611 TaxID=1621259 RepID=UPI0008562D0B|nr:NAD-dependent epimerase/dehydratase family protein [Streptomyces sp. NBRC 110611]GAU65943.1 putative nucleotide-sugar epimerase [Streptomyces sp. NBRC 110611]
MRAVVTGAAGFIGSHLCDRLLAEGHQVLGIDALTDTYDPGLKMRNVERLRLRPAFAFLGGDLLQLRLAPVLDGAEVVFHLAGQPGVRSSWGEEFATYVERNVLTTQRLLEAVHADPPRKLVYASSSSVYGQAQSYPTGESLRPLPMSPYGVTKLAGEQLCEVYRETFGVPTVALRLFTVYGPRQRPDMAFARLVRAALRGERFTVYGDGGQTRDFTFVSDVVEAMYGASRSSFTGVANVGGGSQVPLNHAIEVVQALAGPLEVERAGTAPGDVRDTAADITLSASAFGYAPRVDLRAGLSAMLDEARSRLAEEVRV